MTDFAGYSYAEHKAAITCSHVLSGAPVLIFVHDVDADIESMCGKSGHSVDDAIVVGLSHLLKHIRPIPDMPLVEPGYAAERREPGAPWHVEPIDD